MPGISVAKVIDEMPEAFVSDTAISREVSRAVKAGRLRKIASRLYTRNLDDPPEAIIGRNLWNIVAGYFPGALIADRTALENAPAGDGSVCLISETGRDIRLPGHILRPRRGSARLPSDLPFIAGLFMCSTARAYLENMRASRARGGLIGRTLTRRAIEERLDNLIRLSGKVDVKRLRDDIRTVGKALGMEEKAVDLDDLIGSLLGTHAAELSAPAAVAHRKGRPFDPDRMALFHDLHTALRNHPPLARLSRDRGARDNATLAFYDAYFSNFIEGTEFAVEEAADIVFRGVVPNERPKDARDVIGTWRIVSDPREMTHTPRNGKDLIRLLKTRHIAMMAGRPGMKPGAFKLTENRAGSTAFVAPDLVAGTLEQGFMLSRSLETPFQRATFIMFLISEVHPFTDGNGRIARVMMNAELEAADEERIIIPTVYRANYLSALKALSQVGNPDPLVRVLDYAQRWTAAVDWRSIEETRRELEACNAFLDAAEAEGKGRRLRMPGDTR